MRIPIINRNGNGDRKKKRDLRYSVRKAIREEYPSPEKRPRFYFTLDNYVVRAGTEIVTEIKEDGSQTNKKVRFPRHESPLITGCLRLEDDGQIMSLQTLTSKYQNDSAYSGVNIALGIRSYKGLAYRIGIELEKKHYDTTVTVEKKSCTPNMSLKRFREMFEEI